MIEPDPETPSRSSIAREKERVRRSEMTNEQKVTEWVARHQHITGTVLLARDIEALPCGHTWPKSEEIARLPIAERKRFLRQGGLRITRVSTSEPWRCAEESRGEPCDRRIIPTPLGTTALAALRPPLGDDRTPATAE